VTTTDIAQDLISILDAFVASDDSNGVDSPELPNYWGFSYGILLGQTFASLFPDRVGKFVLDGVENPVQYRSGLSLTTVKLNDDI
jgi:pimeloyl-ACP methyl ester carboxylesterase